MKIIAASAHPASATGQKGLEIANDADAMQIELDGATRIDLHFPKFTDGRAYSQARLLRQRRGFTGELRATGDVLMDQLVHMARCGFDVAVLKEGLDPQDAQRQFQRFSDFYQGDVLQPAPRFARQTPEAARQAA